MIIKFTNYADGIHELEFRESAEKINLGSDFVDEVLLNCEMDKSFHQIVLNCSVHASAKFICDRCTIDYLQSVDHNFRMIYMVAKEGNADDGTFIHFLKPDEDKIDLSDDVKELTLLALPMKHLCDENCKGLCTICGIDLNQATCSCEKNEINPIWEPLLKLKDKLNN